jgi:hypothetical protein
MGRFEEARNAARMAFEYSTVAKHAPSLIHALVNAICPVFLLTGSDSEAEQYVLTLVTESGRHGFTHWQAWGRYFSGLLASSSGNMFAGRRSLMEAFTELRRTVRLTRFLPYLAAQLQALDMESNHLVAPALEQTLYEATQSNEMWALPELVRLKGLLMIWRGGGTEEGLPLLEQAVKLAIEQGALAYALRAATSFHQHATDAPKSRIPARQMLEMVLAHFPAGERSVDLENARQALLNGRLD